ncbi:MAG: sensor histidine kinase [Synergistales bacterium]|nr:sensor histidine kinase [Synergistales bacterium]
MKRQLLLVLFLAIILPTSAVLLTAGFGLYHHENTMERVARSYVENLAENVVYKLEQESQGWRRVFPHMLNMNRWDIFSIGTSIPGWVAVLTSDGNLLFASPGAEEIASIWKAEMPVGQAIEVRDASGEKYTIAVLPSSGGDIYVVAAVAWKQLLGPMIQFNHLWIVIAAIVAVSTVVAILPLWKWVIIPMRSLAEEISSLRWGKDKPMIDDPRAVTEIRTLRKVLYDLSKASIERDELRKRYINDLVKVQEDEKSRIAREIHDGPLQAVTALIQQIRLFKMTSGSEDRFTSDEHLAIAEDAAHNTVRELRNLCDELSPPWLELGLENAMTELADRLSRYFNIAVTIEVEEGLVLGTDAILACFRVFQEAVNNSFRHGSATIVTGKIFSSEDKVIFEISDNGSGFQPELDYEKLRVEGHRGLANITERLQLLGGYLELRSSPGNGALLRCFLPGKDYDIS